MFKKIISILLIASLSLAAMSVNTIQNGSQKELACIKGVGQKRLNNIINYKKSHTLTTMDELLNIKGIGKKVLENIKNDVKKKSCQVSKKAPIDKNTTRIKKNIQAK